jgi:hypothetical protein
MTLARCHQADRSSFSGLFAKAAKGGSIYDDKEEERRQRALVEAERLEKEDFEYKQVSLSGVIQYHGDAYVMATVHILL